MPVFYLSNIIYLKLLTAGWEKAMGQNPFHMFLLDEATDTLKHCLSNRADVDGNRGNLNQMYQGKSLLLSKAYTLLYRINYFVSMDVSTYHSQQTDGVAMGSLATRRVPNCIYLLIIFMQIEISCHIVFNDDCILR